MKDLGKILKQSRIKKFLTSEDVSSITKIKEHYLVSLEENSVENLPARVYSVGFLKNLADLYDLSPVDLIVAYDELREYNNLSNKKKFTGLGKELHYSTEVTEDIDKDIDNQIMSMDTDNYLQEESSEGDSYSFDKIKKLSIGEEENYEASINIIDDYISESQRELKDISENEVEVKEEDKVLDPEISNTYPTSKIMLEFEELMREEERFNTQKLRKQETERNINLTRDRMKNKKFLNLDIHKQGSGNIMILILLGIAIIVLLYIIITAIINR